MVDGRKQMRCKAALVAILALLPGAVAAQPCNPVLEGTYCATLPAQREQLPSRQGISFDPIQSMGKDLSPFGDVPPATFGAISFRGDGKRCIGLLTRGNCS